MKKQIITIAGVPGSGKSTTAKHIAKELSYNHFSSGDLFRVVAAEHGVDVATINQIAEGKEEIDFQVDEKLRQMGNNQTNLVIDSRTAFHWIPDSYKVYLKLDIDIASERVYTQIATGGRVSQTAHDSKDVKIDIETRMTSELKRYGRLYGLDYTDESHYDLVIDTALYSVEEVANIILNNYKERHLGN